MLLCYTLLYEGMDLVCMCLCEWYVQLGGWYSRDAQSVSLLYISIGTMTWCPALYHATVESMLGLISPNQVKVLCHHNMPLFNTPIYRGYTVPACSGMRSLANAYQQHVWCVPRCVAMIASWHLCIGPCNMQACAYAAEVITPARA